MKTLSIDNNNGISNNNSRTFMLENIQQAYWVGQDSGLELSIPARYYVEIEIPAYLKDGLQKALNKLVLRHDMLRAVILPSGEQHILDQVSEYQINHRDLRGLSASDRAERMDELRHSICSKNLSCDIWPQFDIHSTQSDDKFCLHLRFALWMLDGWSFHIFVQELLELSEDLEAELPAIDMAYSDYIRSISQMRQSTRTQKAWEYWEARMEGFPTPPALPLKRQTNDQFQPSFDHISTKMAAEEWQQIAACCSKVGITPNILACTVYADILRQYTGSQRFAISLLYSGRIQHLPKAGNVFGNFGTTILLEVDFRDDQTLLEKARSLQLQFWSDVDHASVSGIEVSRAIQQRAGTGPNIAVPVTFTTVSPPPVGVGSKHIPFEIDHDAAQLEVPQVYLDHQVHFTQNGEAVFNWDYVEQIFPSGFIRLIADAHLELMSRLANDATYWDTQDATLNFTQLPSPVSTHAKDLERLEVSFDRKAKQTPDAIAVIDGDLHLSYGELRRHACSIASLLRVQNLQSGQLVGISMKKGWEQVAAVLGILYAGAAYVPIDPDLPEERRNLLFTSSEARLVLTQSALNRSMTWPDDIERIAVDTLDPSPIEDLAEEENLSLSDLAYVIFTSGSTGVPKGVMIDHRGAANTIADLNDRFDVKASDRILALSSLSFDLSVFDIFGSLAAGATIILPDADHTKDAFHWRELVKKHQVTIWNSVPALMQLGVEGGSVSDLSSLRMVMLSGDWIPLSLPDQVADIAPEAKIFSLGGATEASIWSILYPIEQIDPEWRSIPYGRAMKHQSVYVLDKNLAICPPWAPGELYIGGDGVAMGYWRDDVKTARSFIIHPQTGARLYKTGDLGRYLEDGEIEFLGRSDFQVKIQGYRVECAEVEAAILSGLDIKNTIVSAIQDNLGTHHLVAHLVAQDGKAVPDAAHMRQRLNASLPAYMVPTYFVGLDSLPLSANGKVIRDQLPRPEFSSHSSDNRIFEPPQTAVEYKIAELWKEVLDISNIGRFDNFFAIGGTSFSGMRLLSKLENYFEQRLAFSVLMSHPTIAELAECLHSQTDLTTDGLLMPLKPGEKDAPLFCIHPVGGNVMCYTALAQQIKTDQAIYGLRAPGLLSENEETLDSISSMAERYIEEIRTICPSGPYRLLGWSLGGLVVQEMARVLANEGEELELVAMIDSEVPIAASSKSPKTDLQHFSHFAMDLAAITSVPIPAPLEQARVLKKDQWIPWLTKHMTLHDIPMDAARMSAIFQVFKAGMTALDQHIVRPYGGNQLLFCASNRHDLAAMQHEWHQISTNLEIITLDADHYSIMAAPTINTIADRISVELSSLDLALVTDQPDQANNNILYTS